MTQQQPYFDRGNPQSAQTKAGRWQDFRQRPSRPVNRFGTGCGNQSKSKRTVDCRRPVERLTDSRDGAATASHRLPRAAPPLRQEDRTHPHRFSPQRPGSASARRRYRHQCRHRYRHRPAFRSGLEWDRDPARAPAPRQPPASPYMSRSRRPRPPARSPNRPLHTGAPPYRLRSRRCHPQAHPRA